MASQDTSFRTIMDAIRESRRRRSLIEQAVDRVLGRTVPGLSEADKRTFYYFAEQVDTELQSIEESMQDRGAHGQEL